MRSDHPFRAAGALVLFAVMLALAGCAGQGGYRAGMAGNYAPPGPPDDPWGPYIHEASSRFGVPETWIREVMRQESGGRQYLNGAPITSSAGAMGLMQVMPSTYDLLRAQYRLGPDAYDPHDNILAGTAYIRMMYDRYGSPGFLAAYNAGPGRLDDYLATGNPLPDETVNYVASVAPRLGTAASGPLAAYAGAPVVVAAAAPPPVYAPPAYAAPAYVPSGASAAYAPAGGAPVLQQAVASAPVDSDVSGIQVGAFASPGQARSVAASARSQAADLLGAAQISVGPTTLASGSVVYRARLVGVPEENAEAACERLSGEQQACIVLTAGTI
jgi:hypothetical protein